MLPLSRKDSSFFDPYGKPDLSESPQNNVRYCMALDKLRADFKENRVLKISLSGSKSYRYKEETESPVGYEVTHSRIQSGYGEKLQAFDKVKFWTSHYVGHYTTDITVDGKKEQISIQILPRWGDRLLAYMLRHAFDLVVPQGARSPADSMDFGAEWLLVMLWKCAFDQAIRLASIPRSYRRVEENSRFFRGRLNVPLHIRENLVDQSHFSCSWAPLTMDVTINRAIRKVYDLLRNEKGKQYGLFLKEVSAHDNYLASLGVKSLDVRGQDIDKISYTRMNEAYRPLMQISKAIIGKLGGGRGDNTSLNAMSYFVDISEIWENYLLSVMRKHLEPEGYKVIAPNETGGETLFHNDYRSIRPDFLLKKEGRIVGILDAKYKNYCRLGRKEESGAVRRTDLYQMMTYLHHYAPDEGNVVGLFIAPVLNEDSDVIQLRNHEKQRVGVLNLDISDFKKNDDDKIIKFELGKKERAFADRLKQIIAA